MSLLPHLVGGGNFQLSVQGVPKALASNCALIKVESTENWTQSEASNFELLTRECFADKFWLKRRHLGDAICMSATNVKKSFRGDI